MNEVGILFERFFHFSGIEAQKHDTVQYEDNSSKVNKNLFRNPKRTKRKISNRSLYD